MIGPTRPAIRRLARGCRCGRRARASVGFAARFSAWWRVSIAKDVSCRASEEASSSGCSGSSTQADRRSATTRVRPRSIEAIPTSASIPTRCITCRRCLHVCEEIQGQFVYAIAGRGGEARPGLRSRRALRAERLHGVRRLRGPLPDRSDPRSRPGARSHARRLRTHRLRRSRSPSPSAATAASAAGSRSKRAHAQGAADPRRAEAAVNRGHLCAKGRYAHALAELARTADDAAAARRGNAPRRSAGTRRSRAPHAGSRDPRRARPERARRADLVALDQRGGLPAAEALPQPRSAPTTSTAARASATRRRRPRCSS